MKLALFLVAALAFGGCSSGDITSPQQIVFPDTGVSFRAQVEPLFTLACNAPGCHDAGTVAGGADLTSWVAIRNTPNLVIPKDTTSILLQVIEGRQAHAAELIVNDNQRKGIRQWVMEGAQDN